MFLFENRECDDDLPECLSEQLRLYDERLTSDEEQMVMPGGVNIDSHEDLFRALLEKASYSDTCCMHGRSLFVPCSSLTHHTQPHCSVCSRNCWSSTETPSLQRLSSHRWTSF